MDTARICRREDCRIALAEGSTDNLCPKCLMEELASTADDRDSDEESWESLAYREHGLEVVRKIAEGGEGEIYAAMDEGETLLKRGDVLIQRGTNHSWFNRSDKPCVLAAILVSADPVK